MQSPNKKAPTVLERAWIALVKGLPCSVCDEPPRPNINSPEPANDCHEIKQGQWFTSISLCPSCHTSPLLGLHGQRRMWAIKKMDEIDALAVTIKRVFMRLTGK